MKLLWAGFLGLGLLVVGCGSDPGATTPAADAGDDAKVAADAQVPGSGGTTGDGSATGGAGGQLTADGGAGTGGAVGTGGATTAGTGGAAGTGGVSGSGGAMAGSGGAMGTGGATATPLCVDPDGWQIHSPGACVQPTGVNGEFTNLKKGGHRCKINCGSTQPNGLPGNNIGPPFHVECITPPGSDFPGDICVARCSECQ